LSMVGRAERERREPRWRCDVREERCEEAYGPNDGQGEKDSSDFGGRFGHPIGSGG
jgi:hypothetical protein